MRHNSCISLCMLPRSPELPAMVYVGGRPLSVAALGGDGCLFRTAYVLAREVVLRRIRTSASDVHVPSDFDDMNKESKKRKRLEDPDSSRITFVTPDKTFVRLFTGMSVTRCCFTGRPDESRCLDSNVSRFYESSSTAKASSE
jgi:hypothetical protein